MTNVKLKLMFFLLNALLTADIVHARPYSENATEPYIKYPNNDTFVLPVEPNSDTLIVASDDQTAEETNRNSNTDMEDIVNNEQDRDETLSKKNIKEKDAVLELRKDDVAGFEKQLNISSSLMEDIIDSETDRDETLTDILSKSASELVEDMPRFEFLISTKLNESDVYNRSVNSVSDFNAERNRSRKIDYVELVEVLRPHGENKSAYFANITGHEVDNDAAPDTRFTDLQTVFMACFFTLTPLLVVLFATLFIRSLCRRYCWKPSDSSDSESSENKDTSHQQLKSTEESRDGVPVETPSNGSIITMTLKNNHLIVETEERNDITKNGRETKMKYSPDNDGIFVVEVQQSTPYRPSTKPPQNSPPHDPQISTNQALIHRVPEEVEPNEAEDDEGNREKLREKALALSSTGLSISDLSMSSIGSHNVSYSYGSQIGYEQGPFGYPVYAGYDVPKEDIGDGIIHENSREPLIVKTPSDPDRPVVTAAIFKQDSIIGNDALQGPGYCIEGSTDGPLLSDVQAREVSLQHLHDQMEKKLDNGVAVIVTEKIESPKKTFNRADSLPVRLEEEIPDVVIEKNVALETIAEVEVPSKEALKGKRASLPIIRTEMYESVKDAIIPSGSPKFEKLTNDISPGDAMDIPPPMITITEEDCGKSENCS